MATDLFNNPVHFAAGATGTLLSAAAGSVTNASVAASANIDSAKMYSRFRAPFAQPNTAATAETRVIFVASAAGTILDFKAGSIVAATSTGVVTVDLKKNGASILTGVITLNSSSVAYTPQAGTLSSNTYAAGDVLTVVTTASSTVLPTGVYAYATLDEAPV